MPIENEADSMTSKAVMVQIIVTDPRQQNREPMTRFVVNYSTHEGRERVARCAGWAMNNRYSMTLEPAPERERVPPVER